MDEEAITEPEDITGSCTREGCELPTRNDDVCWWCRNEDAGTCLATG